VLVFVGGSSDRVNLTFGIPYTGQIWFYRVFVWVGPLLFGFIAYRVCVELQKGERVEKERVEAEAEARLAAWRSRPSRTSGS
jgi:hypothetical protein